MAGEADHTIDYWMRFVEQHSGDLTTELTASIQSCVTVEVSAGRIDAMLQRAASSMLGSRVAGFTQLYSPELSFSGKSVRSEHVLHWGRLLDLGEEVAKFAGATLKVPWLLPILGLSLLKACRKLQTQDLNDTEASIVYTIWMELKCGRQVAKDKSMAVVNDYRIRHNVFPLDNKSLFSKAVVKLIDLGCLREARDGTLTIADKVTITS